MTKPLKIAYVKARWHAPIVDQTQIGFEAEMKSQGVECDLEVFGVPGALEMPLVAKKLAATGKYDGVVAAALVVNGGIYRHEFVAQAVVDGLVQAGMETGVPVYSVSLTPHEFQETPEHIEFYTKHFVKKGAEAARAVIMMAELDID
ncbi:riboflavin synthase subunit beta [Amylibacter kogurei]|uniref:6,7-dimethyl-8-ribityllumazine synthase n=1 Tax=Paramylibacter kogurei TaxID=1889778 RepID=A0A2G5K4C7_9RHOB|nr:6,7-dimethyl-8-ribityllumazine synthase [Amylibacter kogurei]PIB24381.1 riboflavin synthase subunit beta [Amylibacter kogurei]